MAGRERSTGRTTRRDFLRSSALVAGAVTAGRVSDLHAANHDRMIIAYGIPLLTLDPHQHDNAVHESVLRNIQEPLVTLSADLQKLEPLLATSWTQLDPRTLQFKLRQGVKFHNGEDLDATAVKFTVDRTLNPETKAPLRTTYAGIERAVVVDRHTVNIVTQKPDPVLLRRMASLHMNILPPKHYGSTSAEELAKKPVGTGPYRFVSWTRDADLVMEASPDYWGQKATIRRVTMRSIREPGTRVAALLSGDVDIITAVSPDDIDQINRSDRARAVTIPGNRIAFYMVAVRKPPLDNKLVRQALNYANNMDGIIKTVLEGHGFRRAVISNPWHQGFDETVKPYPYDPAKAKALLAQAGHPNGISITFDGIQGRYPKDKEIAEAMAGEWAKAGIKVELRFHEWGAWVERADASKFDGLIFASWGNIWMDADFTYHPLFRSEGRYTTKWTGYKNPELDALLDEARGMMDIKRRKELFGRIQRLVHDDSPAVFMHALEDVFGVSTRIQWKPRSDEMVFHSQMTKA
jgi:peptide/nickel transport system substrate-binding protein